MTDTKRDRSDWPVRVARLGEEASADQDLASLTPGQRMEMVWPLTRQVWIWSDPEKGQSLVESRLQRDVVSITRRGR
jgi:hypothetical protein